MKALLAILAPFPFVIVGACLVWMVNRLFPGFVKKGVKWMEG